MASAERKHRIDGLIDQTHAALLNAKKEWHEKGETAALRAFVDTVGLIIATLENVLEEVTPRLRQATMNEVEAARLSAIRERITSLHQEIDTLIHELQKLPGAHTGRSATSNWTATRASAAEEPVKFGDPDREE